MIQKFFIPGPLPGLNDLIAGAKMFGYGKTRWNGYANLKKQHGETVKHLLWKAGIKPVRQCSLAFHWIERDHRRDLDNVAAGGRKIILDSLVKAGVLSDDSSRYVTGWRDTFGVDKTAPGVWVTIEEVT